jgi:uncharacterized protein (DUF302 family)
VKKIYTLILAALVAMSVIGCNGASSAPEKPKVIQDVQVFTAANADGKITTKSIEDAFDSVGLSVPGNNDMNKPFNLRFKKTYYKTYNLAMYISNDLTFNLLKKYPQFGALTPLTMSIWEDKDGNMNVSTLTINGMARATQIPVNDPDLIAYGALIHKALKTAMPNGHFKELTSIPTHNGKSLQVNFVTEVELDEDSTYEEYIEDFESEFEGEMEPVGFLLPNYTNVQEEIFDDKGYTGVYDFFHTYSICKFEVIFPVSKLHPEAGAWAPCSFYLYKKSDEDVMRMGFLGVENWITTVGIEDKESIEPLQTAQGKIKEIINSMIE